MAEKTKEAAHWRDLHKRKNDGLLFAEDIGPPGATLDVEIKESGVVNVSDGESVKPMPWIGTGKAGGKKLGLNVTNCKAMETLTGTADYRQWRGWITLVVVRVSYPDRKSKQKLETDAIRIGPRRPQRQAPKSAPAQSSTAPVAAAADAPPASWYREGDDRAAADQEWRNLSDEERAAFHAAHENGARS